MSRAPASGKKPRWLWAGVVFGLSSALCGCTKKAAPRNSAPDGCQGHAETCLSLTLRSDENVGQVDRLEIMLKRTARPNAPMSPLEQPVALPFNVAVLWPDGPGTISVRTYLHAQMNGVSPELSLDLRNGEHGLRELLLFPPLPSD